MIEARAGLALAYAGVKNQEAAIKEAEEILKYMGKNKTFEGAEEPLRVYHSLYTILKERKEPRAKSVLENANKLLDRQVANLHSEEAQRIFVDNVPWRRALRQEADN